ncbi:MAG: HK97 family phage prohead protease [Nocardioides sp.]
MRIKNAPIRVKAGPDDGLEEGQFAAYASTFTRVPDSYGDIVAPGAFAKTLADWESRDAVIPLLFGHRMDDPDFNIGHVVKAVEDQHGLLVTAQLDLENPKAAQTYRLLKGRRIDQMSFAYDVLDEGQVEVDGGKANELRELSLYEVSVVPIGANQDTEVLAVKAASDALAHGLKAGRVLSAKNESELRKAHDAIGTVLASLATDDDQEKASGHTPAKDEEPVGAKSEEPGLNPSARALAELSILTLA